MTDMKAFRDQLRGISPIEAKPAAPRYSDDDTDALAFKVAAKMIELHPYAAAFLEGGDLDFPTNLVPIIGNFLAPIVGTAPMIVVERTAHKMIELVRALIEEDLSNLDRLTAEMQP